VSRRVNPAPSKQALSRRKLRQLPSSVQLGRGYVVRVVLLTPSQIREAFEEYEAVAETPAGFWDDDYCAVFVDSTLSLERQWRAYWHELLHAVHDIANLDGGGI